MVGIPVFFYFNSKENEKQSPNMVLACLINQLAKLKNGVHHRLKDAFDKRVRPERLDLIDIFKTYCNEFSSMSLNIIVLFDAFDECDSEHYGNIISIIREFNESGIRVYITTRDYLNTYLCDEFKVQSLKIKADDYDVKNFVTLELEKPKTQKISHDLKLNIIEKVTHEVNGM
jgi:hypothetical protein